MTARTPTRVFLVDDHPLVRESLASLVEQQPDLRICGEAETAPAALAGIGGAMVWNRRMSSPLGPMMGTL